MGSLAAQILANRVATQAQGFRRRLFAVARALLLLETQWVALLAYNHRSIDAGAAMTAKSNRIRQYASDGF